MIRLVILATILVLASAQRPSYAGSSAIGYPGLASRFRDSSVSTTTNAASALGSGGAAATTPLSNSGVADRLSESDNVATTAATAEKIPVDARGDANLVNRLNQWPRENRPFWLLNAEHIEKQRNTPGQQQVAGGGSTVLQSRNALDSEQPLVYKSVLKRVTEVPDESFFVKSRSVDDGNNRQVLQQRSNYGTY